jgi:hypothetical protein
MQDLELITMLFSLKISINIFCLSKVAESSATFG